MAKAAPPATSGKLSYKDARQLEQLEALMPRLHAEIAAQERVMEDAGLYQRDPAAFARASDALTAARTRLSQAEEEWLRLEELREQMVRLT